jgi:DNA polymerase III epsilon subunit-like protein
MRVLLLDTETTGLNTDTARIIELGAMVVNDQWQVEKEASLSELVYTLEYGQIDPIITKVTGITQEVLEDKGRQPAIVLTMLSDIIEAGPPIDFVVAYNRGFDEPIVKNEIARVWKDRPKPPGLLNLLGVPWLCAMADLEKNYEFKSWRLMHVALEYGVTVNPKELHRAINDVELMRRMLVASEYTPMDLYNFQCEPWVYTRALCKPPWEDRGESSGIAKQMGYSWERARGDETGKAYPKCWVKRIKQRHVDKEMANKELKIVTIY